MNLGQIYTSMSDDVVTEVKQKHGERHESSGAGSAQKITQHHQFHDLALSQVQQSKSNEKK